MQGLGFGPCDPATAALACQAQDFGRVKELLLGLPVEAALQLDVGLLCHAGQALTSVEMYSAVGRLAKPSLATCTEAEGLLEKAVQAVVEAA